MATTELRLSALTSDDIHKIAAELSEAREVIPDSNHSGSIAPHWAPIVHCEGAFFTLITPRIPHTVAVAILGKLA